MSSPFSESGGVAAIGQLCNGFLRQPSIFVQGHIDCQNQIGVLVEFGGPGFGLFVTLSGSTLLMCTHDTVTHEGRVSAPQMGF